MHCAGYCIPQCNGSASPLIHSSVLEVKILFIIFSILELIFNINLESFKSRTTVSYEVVNQWNMRFVCIISNNHV